MTYIKTLTLISILTALFMVIGYAMGGQGGALIALMIATVMNFLAYWNSDTIVLKMSKAKVADPIEYKEFYDIVSALIMPASLPMPALYIMQEEVPNAFATGRSPQRAAVAITEGIWRLLSPQELSGVIAHELAHIKNRDTLISTITATFAGAISMIANMFMFMSLFGGRGGGDNRANPIVSILLMLVAPIMASVIQMAVSRQREYAADKLGGEICGNPLYLANALGKLDNYARNMQQGRSHQNPATAHMYIINYLKVSGDNLFSTHPSTHNRIMELNKQAQLQGINPSTYMRQDTKVEQSNPIDGSPNNPWLN